MNRRFKDFIGCSLALGVLFLMSRNEFWFNLIIYNMVFFAFLWCVFLVRQFRKRKLRG